MRITGGILKGRIIKVPPGVIRPAMDKMRESVFACLGNIESLSFLDIFSGSGIIALEAASRGAVPVHAVEKDKLKGKILLENVKDSPVRINCHFIPAEAFVKRADYRFDFIFLDPPFGYRYKWDLIEKIVNSGLVKNGTKILIHRPSRDYLKTEIPDLNKYDMREYGNSIVDFFIVNS